MRRFAQCNEAAHLPTAYFSCTRGSTFLSNERRGGGQSSMSSRGRELERRLWRVVAQAELTGPSLGEDLERVREERQRH